MPRIEGLSGTFDFRFVDKFAQSSLPSDNLVYRCRDLITQFPQMENENVGDGA